MKFPLPTWHIASIAVIGVLFGNMALISFAASLMFMKLMIES